jgi:tetratricopeptide (TPR) repeat protein
LARGTYYNFIERDYGKALKKFELAQQGDVDEAPVLRAITMVKLRQGKWNEAIVLGQQAMKLDPHSRDPQSFLVWLATMEANWYTHQYDKALEQIERAISRSGGFPMLYSLKARVQICMGADIEQVQQTLAEWLAMGTSMLGGITGPVFLDLLHSRDQLPDLDASISLSKLHLQNNPKPAVYFITGLLYRYKGDEDSSYLYFDSARIAIHNRNEEARNDTSGRFEEFPLEHSVYEQLALVYSQTDRHEQAIEHAHLAMESMPVEACHW